MTSFMPAEAASTAPPSCHMTVSASAAGAQPTAAPDESTVTAEMALALRAFKGVSIAIGLSDGSLAESYRIFLAHADEQRDILLFESDHDDDVLAEWHRWSALLRLPLLIRHDEGDVPAYIMLGPLRVEPPRPRRARNLFLRRRPLFLRRRKKGRLDVQKVHGTEREIIART